jgi:hypothetical protein
MYQLLWLRTQVVSRSAASAAYRRGGSFSAKAFWVEHRNGKVETGADTDFAFHPQAAVVGFDEMFRNGQAKTGSAGFAGARRVHPVKAFEDAWLVDARNADAGVAYKITSSPANSALRVILPPGKVY